MDNLTDLILVDLDDRETGRGEIVCSEAEALERALYGVPDLRRMVTASEDVVSAFDKKKLLQTALGGRLSNEMSRFLTLLNRNGRMELDMCLISNM